MLEFIRQQDGTVRPADVAEHFQIDGGRACGMLARLAERGLIVRVRYGHYTADVNLARKALQDQLERLTTA
ncbi:hypothetical protein BST23_04225 [Mycolicibacterium elephantis]|uniref:HTH marR-type domain-containing protein n=1 Tax=Mycolicibacterium elephantis TaxID=81858 RepID=A0A1X0D7D3_9MYCO|nr:hypothetical protein BST23_04225 [Mycolicibacterium elephantis]